MASVWAVAMGTALGITQAVLEKAACVRYWKHCWSEDKRPEFTCVPSSISLLSLGLSFPFCKIRGLDQMASERLHSLDVL